MRSVDQNAAMGKPGPTGQTKTPVGAAEGCDLLILLFSNPEKIKIKDRSLRQLLQVKHGDYQGMVSPR
jgi:hypothetical protein